MLDTYPNALAESGVEGDFRNSTHLDSDREIGTEGTVTAMPFQANRALTDKLLVSHTPTGRVVPLSQMGDRHAVRFGVQVLRHRHGYLVKRADLHRSISVVASGAASNGGLFVSVHIRN